MYLYGLAIEIKSLKYTSYLYYSDKIFRLLNITKLLETLNVERRQITNGITSYLKWNKIQPGAVSWFPDDAAAPAAEGWPSLNAEKMILCGEMISSALENGKEVQGQEAAEGWSWLRVAFV